jgi:hypothetical protein
MSLARGLVLFVTDVTNEKDIISVDIRRQNEEDIYFSPTKRKNNKKKKKKKNSKIQLNIL